MIPAWLDPSGVVGSPWMVVALIAVGAGIGFLGGLFGISGGFLLTPILAEILGVPYAFAIASANCYAVGAAATSLRRHLRFGSVDYRLGLALATGAMLGAMLGARTCTTLKQIWPKERFDTTVRVAIIVVLAFVLFSVIRSHSNGRAALLQRLRFGFRWGVPGQPGKSFSVPAAIALAFLCGILAGFLGLGGGVLYLPLLVLAVGVSSQEAVRVTLVITICSTLASSILYAWAHQISLTITMLLMCGSSVGVQVGAAVCYRIRDRRFQRYFALVVLLALALVLWKLLGSVL